MPLEVYSNDAIGTVTSGGTTAPSSGTPETWTVTVTQPFAVASNTATPPTIFYVCDQNAPQETEKIQVVVNPGGTGSGQTWNVIRGVDGTATVAHSANWTVVQTLPRTSLQVLQQPWIQAPPPSGDTTGATDTAAIQGIAAGMPGLGGGIVMLQAGRYYVNQLFLYACVQYWGQSVSTAAGVSGTILTAPNGANPPVTNSGAVGALICPPNGSGNPVSCGMQRLTIDGGNGSSGIVLNQAHQFAGIYLNVQTSRAIFKDINIMNIPGDAFLTGAGSSYAGCQLVGLRIFSPYGKGMNLQGSDYHIDDAEVYTPGLSCYYFNCTTVQATRLKSNYAGGRGVVGDTYGIAVLGNSCQISGGNFAQNDVGSFQTPYTFTATNASPCVFTVSGGATAPGNGTPLLLSGTVPTGFTASTVATGPWTVYYVVASSGTVNGTFELAATPGGAAINSSSTGSGTATPVNGVSVYMAGSRNEIKVATAGASGCHLYLDTGSSDNNIDITTTNQDNTTHAAYIYQINAANVKNNTVKIVGQATTMVGPYGLTTNGGTEQNNQFQCEGEVNGSYSVAFAASVTPDPYQGSYVAIAALTGAITINNPANGHAGTVMKLRLLQDSTGGRVVTFGSNYKTAGAIPTTLSTATVITFVCDAVGGTWREVSRATA